LVLTISSQEPLAVSKMLTSFWAFRAILLSLGFLSFCKDSRIMGHYALCTKYKYNRDTIHRYSVAELGGGVAKIRGGPPSLDPPLDTYLIASSYKGCHLRRLLNYHTKVTKHVLNVC